MVIVLVFLMKTGNIQKERCHKLLFIPLESVWGWGIETQSKICVTAKWLSFGQLEK